MNSKPVALVGVALVLRSLGEIYDQPHTHVETPTEDATGASSMYTVAATGYDSSVVFQLAHH